MRRMVKNAVSNVGMLDSEGKIFRSVISDLVIVAGERLYKTLKLDWLTVQSNDYLPCRCSGK